MTNEKISRHQRAEAFRQQIALPNQRKEAIRTLIAKKSYDEADEQRIKILFNKVSLAEGCEKEYMALIEHLYRDERMQPLAREFYKRWHA